MQKSYKSMKKLLAKPLKALASPGIYLFGKYNQYKREREESNAASTPTENELSQLNSKINKLLSKLNGKYVEMAASPEEECVICINAKAVMQTYPCAHRVVCRRCFVKTIQIALAQRTLPLRCVICRTKILRLRQTQNSRLQPSYSFYSRGSYGSMSKRSSNSYSGSYPLRGNSWTDGFKSSKSLPGINGSSNSQHRSSVNRSYSSVVYRTSTNPMRRSCRSCSLGSYSWAPFHGGQSTSFKPDNIAENADTSPSQEMKSGLITRQKQSSATLSRDELIHRFQRDFHEGQVTSARPAHFKNKSSAFPSQRQPTPVTDLDQSSNTAESQTAEHIDSTADIEISVEERTTSMKIRERMKPYKLLKFDKKERMNSKDGHSSKKDRNVEKKIHRE